MGTAEVLAIVIEIIKYAPTLGAAGSEVIAGAKQIWETISSRTTLTDAQIAEYNAALDAAHEALQNS